MLKKIVLFAFVFIVLTANVAAQQKAKTATAAKPKTSNAVCPDPKKPCHHAKKTFEDWELSFRLPQKIKSNTTYKSAPFYAVIIRKYEEGCGELDINEPLEKERLRLQKLLPARKVFAEYSCPNMEAVGYDFNGKMDAAGERFLYMDYIAVYAGETLEEANKLLGELSKKHPQAEVKKMTAHWERIEQ